ncbi:hypothetical protein N2603_39050 [Bradyrhizobium huanghuaihaiense]|uniref:hypothetical protein n=1 Tax=Bradyrhizobium huanghuaihaiense TaxID=990078 RepID=UPI0021A9FFE1|nr:hypothetical protein [Bradyrhizobium sp. CB3035]UWU75884.1 hypothetical protein N2603_39050 [Bradyrhizobium sp. CB3035]
MLAWKEKLAEATSWSGSTSAASTYGCRRDHPPVGRGGRSEAAGTALHDDGARRLAGGRRGRQAVGIAVEVPRRLVAAVEAVLYARLDQNHTWIGGRDLVAAVGRLLKCALARAEQAVAAAVAQRAAIPIAGGYQAAGAHMMERYVADRIREMLAAPAMGDLIAREVSDPSSPAGSTGGPHAWRSTKSSARLCASRSRNGLASSAAAASARPRS